MDKDIGISLIFEKLESTIPKELENTYNNLFSLILIVIISIIACILFTLLSILWDSLIFMFWWIIFILIISLIIQSVKLFNYSRFLRLILEGNRKLIQRARLKQELNEIDSLLVEILWVISYIKDYKIHTILGDFIAPSGIIWLETDFILLRLSDIHSDLSAEIEQQKQILESAKSEVEKNIKWTIELDSISDLQQVRIDRQIEQFEELQKILIKV